MMRSAPPLYVLLFLVVVAAGCRITDQEGEGTVSPADIHVPASGYAETDPAKLPRMEFAEDTIDVGKVAQGTIAERTYEFTNAGGSELVIADVRSTCGCTVGKNWPKHPMKPGEKGTITVSFDSEGRNGAQTKSITIVSNAVPSTYSLILKAEVIAPGQ